MRTKDCYWLKRIPYEAKIKKGQNVITSGLGGIFPSGLVDRTVEEVEPDPIWFNPNGLCKARG